MFRDPRYLVPLGVLVAVILISAVLGRAAESTDAPAGSDVRSSGVAPTPDASLRDLQRTGDLFRVRDALEAYRSQHGAVPSTGNVLMALCEDRDDPGCSLESIDHQLKFSYDGDRYWYASDGQRFVVIARADQAAPTNECPVGLPREIAGKPIICVRGGG
jgi:hypothetical protein